MTATKKLRKHHKPPTRSALARPSGSASFPLWKHMHDNHGLILLESEMDDICQVADEMRMKRVDGVTWILVNALRHLDNAQLKRLRAAITKRITPNIDIRPYSEGCFPSL